MINTIVGEAKTPTAIDVAVAKLLEQPTTIGEQIEAAQDAIARARDYSRSITQPTIPSDAVPSVEGTRDPLFERITNYLKKLYS